MAIDCWDSNSDTRSRVAASLWMFGACALLHGVSLRGPFWPPNRQGRSTVNRDTAFMGYCDTFLSVSVLVEI